MSPISFPDPVARGIVPSKTPPAHVPDSSVTPHESGGETIDGSPHAPASAAATSPRPGMRPPPPRSVLEEVRNREPGAMGAFFEHYFDLVFGLVLRLLGDRTAAEDVT